MFLNMPETLYMLRMNADGIGVEVEEHKMMPYPEFDRLFQMIRNAERAIKASDLRAWGYEKLMEDIYYPYGIGAGSPLKKMEDDEEVLLAVQYDSNVNTLKSRVLAKRIEMTLEESGKERVADYSIRKDDVDRVLIMMRKTLKEYAEGVEEAWGLLQYYIKSIDGQDRNSGKSENVRRERCLDNLDEFCSTYYMFYLFEQPFMKLVYRLGNRVRIDPIMTMYDIPHWEFDFMHSGGFSARRNNKLLNEKKPFGEWMQDVYKEPKDAVVHREQIKEQIEKALGANVTNEEICYDPSSGCYLLNEETERRMLGKLMPDRAGDVTEIAKYTTFETLVAILKSGKMRMNSIVSMNDKTETDFLEEVYRSYKEDYEKEYDKYLFADKEFITSFTTRIDDLDMWRFYGDNARGVCMVFERDPKKDDELYKIRYINLMTEEQVTVANLMDSLKEIGVRFRLNLLQKYRHFLKHADYDAEDEYRLLMKRDKPDGWFINHDNGILTPYLEQKLRKTSKTEEICYPYKLKKVIVGPAMREKIANMMQIFYYSHHCGYSIMVSESKIQSYR